MGMNAKVVLQSAQPLLKACAFYDHLALTQGSSSFDEDCLGLDTLLSVQTREFAAHAILDMLYFAYYYCSTKNGHLNIFSCEKVVVPRQDE